MFASHKMQDNSSRCRPEKIATAVNNKLRNSVGSLEGCKEFMLIKAKVFEHLMENAMKSPITITKDWKKKSHDGGFVAQMGCCSTRKGSKPRGKKVGVTNGREEHVQRIDFGNGQ